MPLEVGMQIGAYTVSNLIGQGGMGEVYQARDTKLDRDVALKVLPEAFTADPDRLARFEREAKVLASLNHPNIGSIYGLEEADNSSERRYAALKGPAAPSCPQTASRWDLLREAPAPERFSRSRPSADRLKRSPRYLATFVAQAGEPMTRSCSAQMGPGSLVCREPGGQPKS